jgi:NAD(P)-dependent dehydrogenase (short-subunit alcohol dehydrogenase family)
MNSTAIVTGAAGVLGGAVAKFLKEKGWTIIVTDRVAIRDGDHYAMSLPGVDLDVADAVSAACATIAERFGKIDGLANVAGGFTWETIEGGSIDTWDRLYAMNVRSTFLSCQSFLPLLGEGGSIVNVSAAGSVKAAMGMGAYAASKAGVSRLTEALAEEVKDKGIRVNAVMPSIIDTAINRADMPDADASRWVTPEALADVVEFLLSARAGAVTGALLPVMGRV